MVQFNHEFKQLYQTNMEKKDLVEKRAAELPTEKIGPEVIIPEMHKETLGAQATEQQTADELKAKRILNSIKGLENIREHLDITQERAQEFKDEYLKQYGRNECPSETERLQYLAQFVKEDKINEMISRVNRISIKDKIKALFGKKSRAKIIDEVVKERQDFERMTQDKKVPEDWKPCIIGTKENRRMNEDGGSHFYYYDQFGNEYFSGPDSYSQKEYSNFLARYFNVNKFVPVRSRSDWAGSGIGEITLVRTLAETSKMVDAEKIKAEDLDKIDPMPLPDPDKSFVSSCLINLLTSASDRFIRSNKKSAQNYSVRKDGVYYLFDMDAPIFIESNYRWVQQIEELKNYFSDLDETKRKEMLDYLAKTVYFLGALPKAEGLREGDSVRNLCSLFPARFRRMIEEKPLNEKDQQYLDESIRQIEENLIK